MMLTLETSPYFRDLDWDKLKSFYYVAKVGNISHAAAFFNLNQSSFSRDISGLEKHLGYPLFNRRRNGVTLNRKGIELLGIVEPIFIGMKGFTSRRYVTLADQQRRKIRVVMHRTLAAFIFNDFILDYNKYQPDLIFEVIGVDEAIDVVLQDVDIAFQPYDPIIEKKNYGVVQEPFFTLEKKLYASREYLKQYGEPQTVEELRNHHFVRSLRSELYSLDERQKNINSLSRGGGIRNVVYESNCLECLIEAAKQAKGIIATYERLTILKNSGLKNIMPYYSLKKSQQCFVYPEYLKEDSDIISLKKYLRKRIGGL
jgi:DNA-binding transcriptional LysR family regulator